MINMPINAHKLFIITALCIVLPLNYAYACDLDVKFSPHGGITDSVVREIRTAQKSVHLMGYQLTSEPIIKALAEIQSSGKDVEIVLDRSQKRYLGLYDFYGLKGVVINSRYKIAHQKVIVIDGNTVISGSFNFTKSAEIANSENIVFFHSCQNITDAFEAQFQKLYKEGE